MKGLFSAKYAPITICVLAFCVMGAVIWGARVFLAEMRPEAGAHLAVSPPPSKIVVAACPTFYELARDTLDPARYSVVRTASTSKSIALLRRGRAHWMISGRTLRPDEPRSDYVVLRNGYSFLGARAAALLRSEMHQHRYFTDLDPDDLRRVFSIDHVERVDDVYRYINRGIVITTWENTDYSKASTIHVLNDDGGRVMASRRPTLYCMRTCDDENAKRAAHDLRNALDRLE